MIHLKSYVWINHVTLFHSNYLWILNIRLYIAGVAEVLSNKHLTEDQKKVMIGRIVFNLIVGGILMACTNN
jgi:hypothetical protein